MVDFSQLRPIDIHKMSSKRLKLLASEVIGLQRADVRENQLLYYEPASPESERAHHSKASLLGLGGGNRSSKTETALVEDIACATGVFPIRLFEPFMEKFRGPIRVRICVESLTTTLYPIILPKLQWWRWSGASAPGGELGHWGWIPKLCLPNGSWESAWRDKLRTLRVICRDPENFDHVLGESEIQFMGYNQDAADYASGSFHIVHMDEPPPFAIWRENQARVIDAGGRIILSMSWKDDPSIPVDWIFDDVYEPGLPGPNKNPDTEWIELDTRKNIHIDQISVRKKMAGWSEETKKVRIYGQPLRFSNRIHPLFTDLETTWCFACSSNCISLNGKCGCEKQSDDIGPYCHVGEQDIIETWPVVFLLDPHPRKPHMFGWVVVDPNDDYHLLVDGELDGDPADVAAYVSEVEESMKLDVKLRLIDPNMGQSPAGARRGITWKDEFDAAGLLCDLADDSGVGRQRINQFLKPDPGTRRPRLTIDPRCKNSIMNFKRYVWDDFRRTQERDIKQTPKSKYDDYCVMVKYLLNYLPTFRSLYGGPIVLTRPGTRRGAY